MPKCRFSFRLSSQCPTDLTHRNVKCDQGWVRFNFPLGSTEVSLEPIIASSAQDALVEARSLLNRLLTYLFSRIQYGPRIHPGYTYTNLDTPSDAGTTVEVPPLSWFAGPMRIGARLDLPSGLLGAAHMRAGDLASSPFDAFRSYYLAVEAVGKRVRRRGTDSTFLQATLPIVVSKRTLHVLRKQLDKITLPRGSRRTDDPVKDISTTLYKGFRCALTHAGDPTDFTPFVYDHEIQVLGALRLMRGTAWQYVRHERTNLV